MTGVAAGMRELHRLAPSSATATNKAKEAKYNHSDLPHIHKVLSSVQK